MTNWTNADGTVNSAYDETIDMVFSGATGTVTLGSNIIINGNSALFSTDGYVVTSTGEAVVLETTPTITVNAGLTAMIDAPIEPVPPINIQIAALPTEAIVGSPGLTKAGAERCRRG